MRNFIFLLFILVSFSVNSQGFTESRIIPMLNAHEEMMAIFPTSNLNSLDCPPKHQYNNISEFSFLDSLPVDINFDEVFFSLITENKCQDLYEVMATHQLFLPDYIEALKKYELDEKYAILPLILSASNPTLKYLDDKSGAWQLSFVNARKYGLTINQWYDERNDLAKSSMASAAYLGFLKEYYLNNELLIVTAFYTSIPYVNKHLSKLDDVNPSSFIDSLPSEIKGYIWYLRAWSSWNNTFDMSGAKLDFKKSELWSKVETKDTLSFEIISDFMGISISELLMMNPVFVGETVLPNSNQPFYLSKEKAIVFHDKYVQFIAFQKAEEERKKKELAELKKRMESGIPDLKKHKAVTYTVRSGDVLGKIADKNNVKVSQIKQWNNLHSDRIDIGQKLVLYVPKNTSTTLPAETADNKIETKPTQPKPGTGTAQIYTVKPGESLWLIAKKYPGVSAENIMEWNGCTEKISPGMELKIYKPE